LGDYEDCFAREDLGFVLVSCSDGFAWVRPGDVHAWDICMLARSRTTRSKRLASALYAKKRNLDDISHMHLLPFPNERLLFVRLSICPEENHHVITNHSYNPPKSSKPFSSGLMAGFPGQETANKLHSPSKPRYPFLTRHKPGIARHCIFRDSTIIDNSYRCL
jgi:hypothetical protein